MKDITQICSLDRTATFIPVFGYWFYDFSPEIRNIGFDIKDPDSYPFCQKDDPRIDWKTIRWASEFIKPVTGTPEAVHEEGIDISDRVQLENLHRILVIVRKFARDYLDPNPKIRFLDTYDTSQFVLPKSLYEKRSAFLSVAKRLVCKYISFNRVVNDYGFHPLNVWIWVGIYLSKGVSAFFLPEREFTPEQEEQMCEFHLNNGLSIVDTCVNNNIFTHNRFRHILRRYKRLHPDRVV